MHVDTSSTMDHTKSQQHCRCKQFKICLPCAWCFMQNNFSVTKVCRFGNASDDTSKAKCNLMDLCYPYNCTLKYVDSIHAAFVNLNACFKSDNYKFCLGYDSVCVLYHYSLSTSISFAAFSFIKNKEHRR